MTNIRTGKAFTDAPTMTRGGFLKGILASGIAPSITLATIANAGSANASVGGMMRNVGARQAAMFGGEKLPYIPIDSVGTTNQGYTITDYIPKIEDSIDVTYAVKGEWKTSFAILGCGIDKNWWEDNRANIFSFGASNQDREICCLMFGRGSWVSTAYSGAIIHDGNFHRIIVKRNVNHYSVDDSSISASWWGTSKEPPTTVPMALFGYNKNGEMISTKGNLPPINNKIAIRNIRIFNTENNSDKVNFVSASKNGEIGFFELVSNKFYGATGGSYVDGSTL